ncbi:hypothetical protein K8I61_07470 [bacterium]|nr:hypothetical protein [bacterium]
MRSIRRAFACFPITVLSFVVALAGCGDVSVRAGDQVDDSSLPDAEPDDTSDPGDDDDAAADDDASFDDDDRPDDDDDNDDDDAPGRADIVLPPYPFWPNDAFVIDETFMEDLATAYCAAHGDDTNAQEFFLGALPMDSFDLVFDSGAPATPETLMGDLYISGYFGGLWLRDVLAGPGQKARGGDPFAGLRLPFDWMAGWIAARLDDAAGAGDAGAIESARRRIGVMLALYAYNLGYLEQIIEHPPAGSEPPSGALTCVPGQLLDCVGPDLPWAFLARYDDAIIKLRLPLNDAWSAMNALTENAAFFVEQGRAVWETIPLDNLTAGDYARLVDLSIDFLLASKAAALGAMTAYADARPAEARHSLRVSAGMAAWGGSYFLGLASPADRNVFPVLTCPD